MPEGLVDGAKLGVPIATPTTKAQLGHDEPRNYLEVRQEYGEELEYTVLDIFRVLSQSSLKKKVIGADSKFEFGTRKRRVPRMPSSLILADEVWTPDSSRFWGEREYKKSFPAKLPGSMDKQPLRNEGKKYGIDKLDPKKAEDRQYVKEIVFPSEVLESARAGTLRAFEMMYKPLPQFQRHDMSIRH